MYRVLAAPCEAYPSKDFLCLIFLHSLAYVRNAALKIKVTNFHLHARLTFFTVRFPSRRSENGIYTFRITGVTLAFVT